MKKQFDYHFGPHNYRAYYKPAGKGYEVGLTAKGKTLFVGNFIHAKEANLWWAYMHRTFRDFGKRFPNYMTSKSAWYNQFVSNYVYSSYYQFLDRLFDRYTHNYEKACVRDIKNYRRMRTEWQRDGGTRYSKAA